jgi:hypothetical protein
MRVAAFRGLCLPTPSQWASAACHLDRRGEGRIARIEGTRSVVLPTRAPPAWSSSHCWGCMTPDDEIGRWSRDLRERVEHCDLAGLRPIELGHGTRFLPVGITVRTMLADHADLDDPEGSAAGDLEWREERRYHLLDDFRRLRQAIG